MDTFLTIISFILIVVGIIAASIANPFQDGWYWFGRYDQETEVHRKYGTRLGFVALALFFAAFAIMKFVVNAD